MILVAVESVAGAQTGRAGEGRLLASLLWDERALERRDKAS